MWCKARYKASRSYIRKQIKVDLKQTAHKNKEGGSQANIGVELGYLLIKKNGVFLVTETYNVCQKSLEHPYSVKNFPPLSYFRCINDNCEPLPPSYNVESIAEAHSYLERQHFFLQCYSYHLQTTLLYGGGDFVVRLQHKNRKCSKTFGRNCSSYSALWARPIKFNLKRWWYAANSSIGFIRRI